MVGKTGGSLASLRELNRQRIVDALGQLGIASRADVARRTGLSATTVSTLVAELEDAGLVRQVDDAPTSPASSRAGRPARSIRLVRAAGVAVGVEFSEQRVRVVACDRAHQVLAEGSREMPEAYDAREGMDQAAILVEEVLCRERIAADELIGVGLGLPGPIHVSSGKVGLSAILPGWVGLTVADEMSSRLGVPVHVDNDANLAALAELRWGAGRGHETLVYLKVSTGIGAGLVIGGRLFRGVGGTAGEIGHVMVDEHGPICRCGSRGCLETAAGARAIVDLLKPSFGRDLTIEGVLERAQQGDPACRRAITAAGFRLGDCLANVCNTLNPSLIVVGGALAAARNLVLDPLRTAVHRRAIPSAADDVEIVASELGDRAELLGAVALVLHETEAGRPGPPEDPELLVRAPLARTNAHRSGKEPRADHGEARDNHAEEGQQS
ncbi:MAG TPA: ROK family transcriptional regulator [Solirubrobacteraceae bacterium]|nr:ROK family transcriptional regulator [Solirubrobacteraceae bacterium]